MKKVTALFVLIAMAALLLLPASAEQADVLIIEDGKLQPVFRVSDLRAENYTNEGSDILRFCVWVETDYDTDLDGMADLVKVLMQVPRAAAEGEYKAATIYDPTPYGAGTVEAFLESAKEAYTEKPFDYSWFDQPCRKREVTGTVSTLEASEKVDPLLWNYTVPGSDSRGFSYATGYDYYLARGFAVACASGIGTYGSEGFELCGTKLERDSHKAVVEWLAGDRKAFSDPKGTTEIPADWSNGSVAMMGCSYGGTIPFEVAVSGVKGLKTIIPFAGIASWYDYTNAQGVPIIFDVNYADTLAAYNCGASVIDEDWTEVDPVYGSWLWQIAQDQAETNGDYAPIWESLDYTTEAENHIACSGLIVAGLNDWNVNSRHADLMRRTFLKAGQTVKMVLHQDGHNILDGLLVGDRVWEDIVNEWLSHYLYDVENGAESLPAVLAQSNVDGSFQTYDSWDAALREFRPACDAPETEISSAGMAQYVADFQANTDDNLSVEGQEEFYRKMEAPLSAVYPLDVPAGTTLCGTPEIRVSLTSENEDLDGLMISAVLMDVSDAGTFPAFMPHAADPSSSPTVGTEPTGKTYFKTSDLPEMDIVRFVQEKTPAKCVTFGWTDLQNPGMGFDSSDYVLQDPGLEAGVPKDYTFYMNPTVYTLAEGHHLELHLLTWDPYRVFLDENFTLDASETPRLSSYDYAYTVKNDSLRVLLPVAEQAKPFVSPEK